MKKALVLIISLILVFSLTGCINSPKGPGSAEPYGLYDDSKPFALYPLYVSQSVGAESKFHVEASLPGITAPELYEFMKTPRVISLDSIKCDDLQKLFNTKDTSDYLKENYKALWFIREEPVDSNVLDDVKYQDLFVENSEVYVTLFYNKEPDEFGEAISYYEDLILIPNKWEELIGKEKININIPKSLHHSARIIMSYQKMNEFKYVYFNQIVKNIVDDPSINVYIDEAYGEYNGHLIATAYFDGYVHPEDVNIVTELIEGITISYDAYYPIYVLGDNKLYTLTEAYKEGLLSLDDIKWFKAYYYGQFTDFDLSQKLSSMLYICSSEKQETLMEEFDLSYYKYNVIDNFEDYTKLYKALTGKEELGPDAKSEDFFYDNVLLVFPRIVSYSEKFYFLNYYYDAFLLGFYKDYPNVNYDVDYPCVVIGYCFDLVDVPTIVWDEVLK